MPALAQRRCAVRLLVAFLVALGAPLRLTAEGVPKSAVRHPKEAAVRARKRPARAARIRPGRAVVRRVAHRRYYRRPYYHPRARHWPRGPHLEPGRVIQIQRALIQAGYLTGPPTGEWDAATSDAMRRYQAANGFDMTGLPEAKPLMKLGLGPHPLPADVPAQTSPDVDPNPPSDIPNPAASRPAAPNLTGR